MKTSIVLKKMSILSPGRKPGSPGKSAYLLEQFRFLPPLLPVGHAIGWGKSPLAYRPGGK